MSVTCDTICGEKLPLFHYPIYVAYAAHNIPIESDTSRTYMIGSIVPYNTMYYDYTPDFACVSNSRIYFFSGGYLKDVYVIAPVFTAEIDEALKHVNKVVDEYGDEMPNIHTFDDLINLIRHRRTVLAITERVNNCEKAFIKLMCEAKEACIISDTTYEVLEAQLGYLITRTHKSYVDQYDEYYDDLDEDDYNPTWLQWTNKCDNPNAAKDDNNE